MATQSINGKPTIPVGTQDASNAGVATRAGGVAASDSGNEVLTEHLEAFSRICDIDDGGRADLERLCGRLTNNAGEATVGSARRFGDRPRTFVPGLEEEARKRFAQDGVTFPPDAIDRLVPLDQPLGISREHDIAFMECYVNACLVGEARNPGTTNRTVAEWKVASNQAGGIRGRQATGDLPRACLELSNDDSFMDEVR